MKKMLCSMFDWNSCVVVTWGEKCVVPEIGVVGTRKIRDGFLFIPFSTNEINSLSSKLNGKRSTHHL